MRTNVPVIAWTCRNLKRSSISVPGLVRGSWLEISQQRHHRGNDKESGDGAGQGPLRGARDVSHRLPDAQPADATAGAGKEGREEALDENADDVLGVQR